MPKLKIESTLEEREFAVASDLQYLYFFHQDENQWAIDVPYPRVSESLSDFACDLTGLYQHFKGGRYLVIGLALDCSTHSLYALYFSVQDVSVIWARPLDDFLGKLESGQDRFVKQLV